MASILIADSGSTKTDWSLVSETQEELYFKSSGINPYLQKGDQIDSVLGEAGVPDFDGEDIREIVFYGAGIGDPGNERKLKMSLERRFHCKQISIYSDLLAAAHATCGKEKGMIVIMGTGSNCGYFDGINLIQQNPSLGYILGDEGGGVFLGKRVVQYFFYNTFDEDLHELFKQKYGANLNETLRHIYQMPFANRYLASFVPFLKENRGHYMVENILEDAFLDFYQRHLLKYRQSWNHSINFCGSVAYEFQDVLQKLQNQYGLDTGKIIKAPMKGLCHFYRKHLSSKS